MGDPTQETQTVTAADIGEAPAPVDPKVERAATLERHVERTRAQLVAFGSTKHPRFAGTLGDLVVTAVELGQARCDLGHEASEAAPSP